MEDFKTRLYHNREGEGRNFLLLFSVVYTLAEMLAPLLWEAVKPIFFCLSRRIKDGYWLVLLSPAVLVTWVVGGAALAVMSVVPTALAVVLMPSTLTFGIVLELPSDFINKKNKRGDLNLSDNLKFSLVWASIITIVAFFVIPLVLTGNCPPPRAG